MVKAFDTYRAEKKHAAEERQGKTEFGREWCRNGTTFREI
jgi:hypothetical protein